VGVGVWWGEGSRFKLSGTDNLICFLAFRYLSTVQMDSFRIRPSYTAVACQYFRFGVKICRSPAP